MRLLAFDIDHALGAFFIIAVCIWWLVFHFKSKRQINILFPVATNLLENYHPRLMLMSRVFYLLAALALSLALFRPQWGQTPQAKVKADKEILILLDVSRSMDASDVGQSRMELSKEIIRNMALSARSQKYGIVAFAGDAFYYCPFTDDHHGFMEFLNEAGTHLIPDQGTDFTQAVKIANEVFARRKPSPALVLVFTDGENQTALPKQAIINGKGQNIPTIVIGVGTTEGAEIPMLNDATSEVIGILRKNGKNVISKLNPDSISELAGALKAAKILINANISRLPQVEKMLTPSKQEVEELSSLTSQEDQSWLFSFIAALCLMAALTLYHFRGMPFNRT